MPLTGTVDADNARIDLFVDYVPVAGTQNSTTLRRHTGAVDAPGEYVRGLFGTTLLGEQAYVSDHEAPLDKQLWYSVISPDTSEVMTAGPFTIPSNGYVWMKDPGRPWADLRLDLCVNPSTSVADCPPDPLITDTFSRTVADAWGSTDTGEVYTVAGGPATDYSVSGGQGRHLMSAVNSSRRTTIPSPLADLDAVMDVAYTQTATGGAASGGFMMRSVDGDNTYLVRLEFGTDGMLRLQVLKRVAAVQTTLANVSLSMSYAPGQFFTLRIQVQGQIIRANVWPVDVAPGEGWKVTVNDTSFAAAGAIGMRSLLNSSNTNVGSSFVYDNFQVSAIVEPEDDIAWVGFQEKNRAADAGLFPVLDKERPADVYARRKDITTGALFLSRSLDAINRVYFLYTAGGPIMIQVPSIYGMDVPGGIGQLRDRYYQPDTLKEEYLSQDQRKPLRLWSVPLTSVEIPIGEPQGTDAANWCAIEESYTTFADLTATGLTWGQIASGEA